MRALSNVENESIEPHEFAADVVAILSGETGDTPAAVDEDTPTFVEPDIELGSEESTDEEPAAVTEDEHGNLHGPDGKFVAKDEKSDDDEEGEETEPEAEGEPEEWVLELDEDLEGYLNKYDGDVNKALRAAVEASKMIGRQGSQLGENRQEVEQLRSELAEMKQLMTQVANRPTPQAVDYGRLIDKDPKEAAQTAARNGDVDAMMAAVNVWADSDEPRDAFEAAMFLSSVMNGYQLDELRSELAQAQAAAPTAPASNDKDREVAKVLQRHPDLEKHLPTIGKIAQERPLLRQALEHGTPQEAAIALEDLYLIARSRSETDTSAARRKVQVRVAEESRQARADAAVVRASRGTAASGDQPTRVDQFLDAFETRMKEKGLLADE